jgi:REP element-mobilizing transposase RayT
MARPIRIEFEGALYHVTSRGDRREAIYEDDADRARFLEVLGEVASAFNWVVHAYCLMSNHYHLLIETPDANLSKGMRQLNGVFTQYSNRRHRRTGHLFQGRYKAILVDADSYLLELSRYVVLNPVRARMVADAGDWPWSSYGAMVGAQEVPGWLAIEGLLSAFASTRSVARRRYMRFVAAGVGADPIWKHLNRQVYLGSDDFVQRMQEMAGDVDEINVPRTHRRPPPPSLEEITAAHPDRDAAMVVAHRTGEYSYAEIARHFGVHFTTVGRVVRAARKP